MSDNSFSGSLGVGKDRYTALPHDNAWGVYDNVNKRWTQTGLSKANALAAVNKLKNRHRKD